MYMTPEEVAKDLRVDVTTVRHWIRSHQLPAMKVGRQYRIKYEDYDNFLKSRLIQKPNESQVGSTLFA
jgi:excisionase family DNA binding protein